MSVSSDITGAMALADWLGEGGNPVPQAVAESRAVCCTSGDGGRKCQHNVAPNWWDRVKHVTADWIKAELEAKNQMRLSTAQDANLAMCSQCGCCLQLKIFVPIKHIRTHTDLGKFSGIAHCWIRKELSETLIT